MAASKRRYTMTARAAKARETRDRIRESTLQLYLERSFEELRLEDVARRAQTTVQTILRVYGSKENLVLAALDALAASGTPARPTEPGDVAAAVHAIFDIYESIGDDIIARLADERRLPRLKPSLDRGRANHLTWVRTVFAPQLRERQERLEMLSVLTDVYVWKILRRDRRIGRTKAESIVAAMVSSVTEEARHGEHALAQLVRRRKLTT